jgi:hypothetical protein
VFQRGSTDMRTVELLATVLVLDLCACRLGRFDSDSVMHGAYGITQSGGGGARAPNATPAAGTQAQAGQARDAVTTPIPTAGSSAPVSTTGAAGIAGAASPAQPVIEPAAGSSGGTSPVAGAGTAAMPTPGRTEDVRARRAIAHAIAPARERTPAQRPALTSNSGYGYQRPDVERTTLYRTTCSWCVHGRVDAGSSAS